MDEMKYGGAIAVLTVIFLSAGAFADNGASVRPFEKLGSTNITVVNKNQSWPAPSLMTIEPCNYVRCIDV
jgi:hypothetical protein